ncbi:DNA polymerase III subunit alpha [uncultured Rhodoblastus sp.]|uniref:DNA polymerase III subunit alpha n=1 Tax=uncultured Rhodoblastus sp. TaxID=543037 RepID=UPI0025FC603B|nr:DNA polymerase III subunit alpha [uncultured Rhodoblastus sp.]
MTDATIAAVGFVHLHVHTSFSLREGALPVGKLLKLALADLMPALAVTDSNNLFGALEISEKFAKDGVQPIPGCQLTVDFGDAEALRTRGEAFVQHASRANIVLLAQNEHGYDHLMHLVSQAWLEIDPGDTPHVSLAQLALASEGLIALSGGPAGPLDRAFALDKPEAAYARLAALAPLFSERLYIELQRHGLESEEMVEPRLIDLAIAQNLPLVATNEPYFAAASDYEAHDALLCIADGAVVSQDDRRRLTRDHRFKTRAEMVALFADLPEATRNSVEIAMRCSWRPLTRKPILPNFTQGAANEAAVLRAQAVEGLTARLAKYGAAPGHGEEDYRDRLDFELSVIEKMNFPGYFLIVADFIQWAKARGIPVGPGRGSGAGSLVAWALTVTDLDPIRFSLLFERFLNPERVSMPDFDIDFCQTRRDEVIAYVRRRYGADKVAQIITFGSFLARGVLRNVGRVLEMPLGLVDKLAKMVPQNPAAPVTLKQAIDGEARLREAAEQDSRVKQLLEIAQKLEGLYSNASTHAAGIVIGDRPLDQLVPLYRDPKSDMPATQFNMKWVEPAGLVKFDFLGLKTLTTLATCAALLERRGVAIDLTEIPLDDAKTFDMLGRGETIGVFQLESAGMRKALSEMRADRFEDIIALVALYRPGPMANIPTYCAVKLGEEDADYIHPKIEPVLKETFGVIIYQEQVMQIAQILSGYSLGEADMLRRAMGKKIKAEMDAQRARFVDGAMSGGLERAKADEIFDLLAKFADYGFNKSHAAAYALVAYQTAWCKANYPVEFLAASMTLDKNNTDKLAEFRNEAQRLGIRVDPPSINFSGVDFDVHADDSGSLSIRYALSAVKGVGEGQAAALVAIRGDRPFRDLADLATRLNPREVNKKVLESLAAAGACDEIERDRARAHASVEPLLAVANRNQDESLAGQSGLFGGGEAEPLRLARFDHWSAEEKLRREFDAIGFFISGHPLDAYHGVLQRLRVDRWATFFRAVKQGASAGRLAATVLDRTERRTRNGAKMGIVTLSDPSGQYEAILFQEGLNLYRDLLEKGATVLVTLQANIEGEDVRARITLVEKLDEAAARIQKGLRIFLHDPSPLKHLVERLKGRAEGEVTLVLRLDAPGEEVEVKLPGRYPINAQASNAIKAIPGVAEVEHI